MHDTNSRVEIMMLYESTERMKLSERGYGFLPLHRVKIDSFFFRLAFRSELIVKIFLLFFLIFHEEHRFQFLLVEETIIRNTLNENCIFKGTNEICFASN